MSTAVVFFSRDGNTKFIAEHLASKLDARSVELTEARSRRGFLGFMRSGYQASTKKSAQLVGDPWSQIAGVRHLYLLAPIWAGNANPVINAFLDQADLAGVQVSVATVQADPGGQGADAVHLHLAQRIVAKGGVPTGAWTLHGAGPGKRADEEHLLAELAKIQAPAGT